jgi:hypothetical protein
MLLLSVLAPAAAGQPVALQHNRAVELFNEGRIAEAREIWARVADQGDAVFEARMVYNLGNCDYAEALALRDAAPRDALRLLEAASERYLDAIGVDPSLEDARANLELAQLLIRQLEQRPEDEGDDGGADRGTKAPESQPSESPEERSEEPNEPEPSDAPESAEEPNTPSHPDQPGAESPPTELPPESPPARRPAGERLMTAELAERLLQMVRDSEQARHEELARRRERRREPVERDW